MQTPTSNQELKALVPIDQLALIEAESHLMQAKKIIDIFNLGLRFFRYGKLDLALIFFYEVLEQDENNAQAYVNLGNIFYEMEEHETATRFWKHALKIDSSIEKAYLNLGNYYFTKGSIDEAISFWLILYGINPFEVNVLANLGMAYDKKDDIFMANYYYMKYLEKAKHNPTQAYGKVAQRMSEVRIGANHNFKVGVKHQERKNYRKAMKAYMNVLHTYPNHLKANLNMGSICYLFDKFEDSIKYWIRAFFLDPKNKKNIGNIAVSYDKIEQYSYAYCFFKRYLKMTEELDTFEALNMTQRVEDIEKILGDKQSHYSSHYTKAEESFRKRDYFNAYMEYGNALILNPSNEELKKKLKALKANVYPEQVMSINYLESGKQLFEKGKINTAIEFFKKAYYLNQDSEEAIEAKKMLQRCANLYKKRS